MRIEYGQTPSVLLLGNGINRAYGFASWDGLIRSIQTKKLTKEELKCLNKVPYPLQPIILTEDNVGQQMRECAVELTDLRAPDEEEELLRAYASLPVDTILTTNYTYELEKALIPDFKCYALRFCKARKTTVFNTGKDAKRQLHTYYEYGNERSVWHIHGEAARPDTTVLGHYYYGKNLSKMQQYIPSLISRYRASFSRGKGIECYSWIDYFMTGNVFIVGLGMDLSEFDLWWLVNCKKRHFENTSVVIFKPDITPEQRLLAEAYGIKIKAGGLVDEDYRGYYRYVLKELQQILDK